MTGGLEAPRQGAETRFAAIPAARNRLFRQGPESLTDHELLALWLSLPDPGGAARVMERIGGLAGLLAQPPSVLLGSPGLGPGRVARVGAAATLLGRAAHADLDTAPLLSCTSSVRRFLRLKLAHLPREVFACLFLDSRHRLIRYEVLFLGTVDRASVHPREVLKRSLELNAAALILAHNHPSGVAEPSASDLSLTRDLKDLLARVDVRLLDHLVVGRGSEVSLAERGLLE